jgi:hypothetical protein
MAASNSLPMPARTAVEVQHYVDGQIRGWRRQLEQDREAGDEAGERGCEHQLDALQGVRRFLCGAGLPEGA